MRRNRDTSQPRQKPLTWWVDIGILSGIAQRSCLVWTGNLCITELVYKGSVCFLIRIREIIHPKKEQDHSICKHGTLYEMIKSLTHIFLTIVFVFSQEE